MWIRDHKWTRKYLPREGAAPLPWCLGPSLLLKRRDNPRHPRPWFPCRHTWSWCAIDGDGIWHQNHWCRPGSHILPHPANKRCQHKLCHPMNSWEHYGHIMYIGLSKIMIKRREVMENSHIILLRIFFSIKYLRWTGHTIRQQQLAPCCMIGDRRTRCTRMAYSLVWWNLIALTDSNNTQ